MLDRDSKLPQDLLVLSLAFGAIVAVGLLLIGVQENLDNKSTALLWSVANLALGALLGFLFGIPRVLQGNPQIPSGLSVGEVDERDNEANSRTYRLLVNTNLEQISDWLTKIIVGVGLVQLTQLPERLDEYAAYVAQGIGGTAATPEFAAAMIIYFLVFGFLGGYLLTRVYLTVAFSRADIAAQTVTFAGRDLSFQEVTTDLNRQIADIREQIVNISKVVPLPPEEAREALAVEPPHRERRVQSILWVDDKPKNNSLLIDQLASLGLSIATSLSTKDALSKMRRHRFDGVISDMGRLEERQYNHTAGLDLLESLRNPTQDLATEVDTPFVIFCSRRKALEYREQALAAGATGITSSATELLRLLEID